MLNILSCLCIGTVAGPTGLQGGSRVFAIPSSVSGAVQLLDFVPSPRFVNAIKGGVPPDLLPLRYLKPKGASDEYVLDVMDALKASSVEILGGLARYVIALGDPRSSQSRNLRLELARRGVPGKNLFEAYWEVAEDDSAKLEMLASYLDRSSRDPTAPWLEVNGRLTFHPERVPPVLMRSLSPVTGGEVLLRYLKGRGKP